MAQSQALVAVATAPVVDDSVTYAGALIRNYGHRVIQNGPGMHLKLTFTAGGGVSSQMLPPRVEILDELFLLRARRDENSVAQPQKAPQVYKTIVKLKKLSGNFLKFTNRTVVFVLPAYAFLTPIAELSLELPDT
ncbi:hypothetical protein FIBSPDRAFT_904841 [Athelia psychrophila]|uniref:Uncharacterized protein n=1 Tax=Athelia psychrophila TaxID=1759441 RepID=A0A167U801_9AGAM|nr:hypothetical protein FIBSPDRAFT_904841 [Fibularhizoctonia sp. CBS 109695]